MNISKPIGKQFFCWKGLKVLHSVNFQTWKLIAFKDTLVKLEQFSTKIL